MNGMLPSPRLIKTSSEIEKMKVAGKLAADVLDMIRPYVQEGVSTEYLNQLCHDYIVDVQKAIPAPLNYHGFPKSICTSVNQVVCHGIPSDNKILKNGDIVNLDITVIKDGYFGDTSEMFMIGQPSILARRLCDTAHKALFIGIEQVKPGNHIGQIGAAIQKYIESERFSVVREYCGHGIGDKFHDEPQILHYGTGESGMRMMPGMTFTIEPMVNAGGWQTKVLGDGWTVVTKDHKLSAQYEHTILVTKTGYEILTLRESEASPLQ